MTTLPSVTRMLGKSNRNYETGGPVQIQPTRFGNACLEEAFTDPDTMVKRFVEVMERQAPYVSVDTLVGQGFSGALVVPQIAQRLGLNYVLVRKPGDSHHHGNARMEGNFGKDWLFVDDGISTGTTFNRTAQTIREQAQAAGIPARFAGAYLYGHDQDYPAQYLDTQHWLLHQRGRGY